MVLKNHCLFCLEKISPYSVSIHAIPTFTTICNYLKIKCSKTIIKNSSIILSNERTKNNERSTSSCATFLCFGCFEMVEELAKSYQQFEEIQAKIKKATKAIQDVIALHDINSELESQSKIKDHLLEEVRRPGIQDEPSGDAILEFIQMFQTLVKEASIISIKDDIAKETEIRVFTKTEKTDNFEIKIESNMTESIGNTGASNDIFDDLGTYEPIDDSKNFIGNLDRKRNNISIKKEEEEKRFGRSNPNSGLRKKTLKRKAKSGPAKESVKRPKNIHTCPECKEKFESMVKLRIHQQTHILVNPKSLDIPTRYEPFKNAKSGKRYYIRTCTICSMEIRARCGEYNGYMEHLLTHEEEVENSTNNPEVHQCPLCEKKFYIKLNLDLHHVIIHKPPRQFLLKCDTCGRSSFKGREDLIDHLKSHSDTIYSCKSCAVSFTTLDKLLYHMHINHAFLKSLMCPLCDLPPLRSMSDLSNHCANVHPDHKKTFTCPYCENKPFLLASSLKNHMIKSHFMKSEVAHAFAHSRDTEYFPPPPKIEPKEGLDFNLTCPQCNTGRTYHTKLSLDQHITRKHTKPKFNCDQCNKGFHDRSTLQQHIENKHDGVRYPCPYCSSSYSQASSLTSHLKIHTKEGLFSCDVCSKQFSTIPQLKIHSEVHKELTDDESYVCEMCGLKCKSRRRLLRHKRQTHQEKKFKCHVCQKMFKRSDHLTSHMRIHSGERPFQCRICDKAFNRRDILRVHMKGIHHMGDGEVKNVVGDTSAK